MFDGIITAFPFLPNPATACYFCLSDFPVGTVPAGSKKKEHEPIYISCRSSGAEVGEPCLPEMRWF